VLGTPVVYLNSAEVAMDLLHKRGNIYSDRPHLPMACDMYVASTAKALARISTSLSRCALGDLVPLTKYGDRFKTERRLMNQVLSPTAIEKWQPIVMKEVHSLLKQVLDDPEEYLAHVRRCAVHKFYFARFLI
jgi:cytochrome P450